MSHFFVETMFKRSQEDVFQISWHLTVKMLTKQHACFSILFAVFINDLTSAVQKSQTELYADDALIHKDISKDNIPQEMHSLQTSVSDASAWPQSWRGRFSPAKTVVLPLGNLATNACQQFPLSIDEENIDIVETHKHLGVSHPLYRPQVEGPP